MAGDRKRQASAAAADMKIARVQARPLAVPIAIEGPSGTRRQLMPVCLAEIETAGGLVGHGLTAITDAQVVAAAIDRVAAPALAGEDAMAHERLWDRLYWRMAPRGQTGYALHAIAALDIALWDLKGKALGQPLWRLFGGARDKVPLYTTFGFDFFDRDELAAAAKAWLARGHHRLKMTVGHDALQHRDRPRPIADVIAEDARRVAAVREAVGPDAELYVDANCSLDLFHAQRLARMMEPYGLGFFEEPVTQNDVHLLADLRRQTAIPLAAGQNEGLAFRFRDFLVAGALDVVQPNAAITGGYTQCLKIAGMAAAFNAGYANGGAWPFHNMHLHAGLANGGLVEWHYPAVLLCQAVYDGLPQADAGWLKLPEVPGLGFAPKPEALKDFAM
ncbi:MAG TPA: mandelate racemase/muconate lactonizing enzyme family protein [Hyphomicrobiales bacterium]|nr:mandelate racemase/muconate lactonizing enzyme family protein [Hyphomicrobiales bacterium]